MKKFRLYIEISVAILVIAAIGLDFFRQLSGNRKTRNQI